MGLPVNIDDLIHARTVESVRIEFKRGWNPEEIIHSICAFANDIREYGGGYIVVGLEEDNGVPILPPYGVKENQIDRIQKDFINLCFLIQPKIFPVIEPILFEGEYIIVIWVTTGEERPYTAPSTLGNKGQRRIYVRPASVTIPTTPELEKQLRDLVAYKHFDDKRNTKASVNDLDLGLIMSYLQEVKSQLFDEALKMPFEELCLKMQIIRGQKEDLKPLNVALLLFCKEPEKFFEGCKTNLVEFEDESGTTYSEKVFKGPVHLQIREIMEYLNSKIIQKYIRKSSLKAESDVFYNYPFLALEEAIVNSLYHRSYEEPRPNEIRIYKFFKKEVDKAEDKRRIEIRSYPGPLPPIDNQSLSNLEFNSRNYRNLKLGDWLRNIRLAEKYATGIPTILSALEKNGSPKPLFWTDDNKSEFLVTIKIHEDTPYTEDNIGAEVENLFLTNLHQSILEKIKDEPVELNELRGSFKEDITKELEALRKLELLSRKLVADVELLFITPRGIEALKISF
jgi:ATP-dependent DNA helicase RecG